MTSLKRSVLAAWAVGLMITAATALPRERAPKPIEKGAQIGVVNLLNAEVMHYHAAIDSNGSFLKIHAVSWSIDDMLADALQEPLAQLGLTMTPLMPTATLLHARESCFVNASLADGLPKSCAAPLLEQASSGSVSYLIILAPGLNDANHAGRSRMENVTAMMRGWGFLTRERAGAKDKPTLFDEVELLLVGVGQDGVTLRARQWGGAYTAQWQSYTVPADPHQIPDEELNELQPMYTAMLSRQAKDLVGQIHVQP